MTTEVLTWAGIPVDTFAVRARDLSGLLSVPARVGDNIPVYGAHGARRTARKKYGPGRFGLEFLLRGVDPDTGLVPGQGQAAAFYEALDMLTSLVGQEVATLRHTLPDGSERETDVEVIATTDPTRFLHGGSGVASVVFDVPVPFWRDTEVTTVGPVSLADGETLELDAFAGCTAPMDDGVVTFGPGPNPRITQPLTGGYLAYGAVIGTGQSIAFDGATFAYTGGGGLVPDWQAIENGPDAAWLSLECGPGGAAPVVQMETSAGPADVTFAYKRKWLVG